MPFRKTTDPYRITVAEIMLQQTQVDRVLPRYRSWIKKWPTWRRLAVAGTRELLEMWSGLGYNRRALYLGRLAQTMVNDFGGKLPDDPAILGTLPGIGPYTARAVLIFAFNRPLVAIDTNIRRVLIHEFGLPDTVSQAQLESLAGRLLPRKRSREWHNALMDYSRLALPARIPGVPPLSRQSRFVGSQRQVRGEIIRQLVGKQRITLRVIARDLDLPLEAVRSAARSLAEDGIVIATDVTARLAKTGEPVRSTRPE